MKRSGIILLALLMALLPAFILPGSALEEGKVYTAGDYDYILDSSSNLPEAGVIITAYHGKEADLVIPESLDGHRVNVIGEKAFQGNTYIKSVKIPDSVVLIGPQGFSQCNNLKFLTLGGKVQVIGKYAFNRCNSLESVILPDSVTSVETGAFSYCKALQSVTIGRNNEHFYGSNPFVGDVSLKEIILPPNHPTLYLMNSMLFEKAEEGVTLVLGLSAVIKGELTIPEDPSCIGNDAFNSCGGLISVRISNSVVKIGTTSFANNPNLTSILIPPGVIYIGGGAFAGTGIMSAVIPEGVKSLEHGLFADCRNLKEVTLSEGLEEIREYVFSGCVSLTSLLIPMSVKYFGEGAFDQCPAKLIVYAGSPGEEYCINTMRIFERLFGSKVEF